MTLPKVTWLESPYRNNRDSRYPIRGVVNHRIVGSLASARGAFGVDPNGTSRNASSHFGIGTIHGVLTIDQYVDLSYMAWTNGDVREPTWPFYQAGVNPNLTTVTIEHQDGGYAGRGVVTEAIWQASMELQKLLVSGDLTAIRAAGIRVTNPVHVAQLAAVPKDARGFIDHHQIAGPNKPHCFRRWLDDPGFVEGSPSRRDRLLAFLEEPMPVILRPVREKWRTAASADGSKGYFTTDGPGVGDRKWFTTPETVESYAETADGVYRVIAYGPETLWMERSQLTPVAGSRIPATGYGLVSDYKALYEAEKAKLANANKTIASLKGKIAAGKAALA